MTRLEAVAGLAVFSLIAGGIGHKYVQLKTLALTPDPERPVTLARERRPIISVDSVLSAYLMQADAEAGADVASRLDALLSALDSPDLALSPIDDEVGARLAQAVLAAWDAVPGDSPEGLELRRRAVAAVVGRTAAPESKALALRLLSEGPQPLRNETLRQLGRSGGVRGPELFAKVRELQASGSVPEALLPGALRRTGGNKAKQPLLELLASTDSKKLIAGCAVALQDYRDPELVAPVLERLEQLGMLDEGVKMPWLSAPLLTRHLQSADGARLRRGMLALRARPALAKSALALLEKGLSSPDAETRRVAVQAVKKAVAAKSLGVSQGESLLAGRVETETEPVLKAELTGSLDQIRTLKAPETGTQ